jgi:hypothetical protein
VSYCTLYVTLTLSLSPLFICYDLLRLMTMAPIENPSISEIIPRRPGRSYYYPTRHETLRFGDGDIIMPASNNPPPFPVPYPDDSSQHVAPPGTFPSANYHFFPPLTPQNPIQQSADRQSIVVRHSSFDNSVLTLSASRFAIKVSENLYESNHLL